LTTGRNLTTREATMGRRGPKPKPSALDKLDGGASHRRRNRNEPKPAASDARCPSWLRGDPIARAIWRAEAPAMIRVGLLSVADRLAFAALCERAALYRRAVLRLRKLPKGEDQLLFETKANGKQPRPELGIAKEALAGFRQFAAAFGMTPADRKGLEVALGAPAGGGDAGSGDTGTTPAKPDPHGPIGLDDWLSKRGRRRG
jgi:P27 family predicted phage terminase small subunit